MKEIEEFLMKRNSTDVVPSVRPTGLERGLPVDGICGPPDQDPPQCHCNCHCICSGQCK